MNKLIFLAAICLMLTACGSRTSPDATSAPTQTIAAPTTEATVTATESTEPETTARQEVILTVYSPDEDLESFVTSEIPVDEITAETITLKLILAGVLEDGTYVNAMEMADTQLNVDFNAAFRDLILAQGSTGERAVMGSVVNTFLTAYDAQSICITVDGEILESGHVIYDMPLTFYE